MPDEIEIVQALREEIKRARDNTQLRENWQEALDYYLQRPRGDSAPGQSNARSYDVADVVEAHVAEVMPAFSGDSPAEFEPEFAGDEEQAELESMGVNKFLMEMNPGFLILSEAVKEAALLKNCIVKVWIQDQEMTRSRRFEGVSDDEIAAVIADNPDISVGSRRGDSAVLTETVRSRKLRIKTIPREHIGVSPEHTSPLLEDAPFVYERRLMRRSELIAEGISKSKVMDLPPHNSEDFVQARHVDGIAPQRVTGPSDRDLIEVFECHYVHDPSLTGKPELWRYLICESTLLDAEPASFMPYASGTGTIVPSRFDGLSIFDKVKEIADQKTDNKRNWLENQAVNNRPKVIAAQGVNLDDLESPELLHPIRTNGGDARAAVQLFQPLDTSASNLALAQYLDKERSERAGAVMEMQAAEPQILRSQMGSLGAELVMSAQEIRSANVVRTLAETLLRSLFLLVHTVLREEWQEPVMLQRAGEWVESNPAEWRPRSHLNIRSALSASQRNRQVQNMSALLQIQSAAVQAGLDGILVDPASIHNAIMDWAKSADIDAAQKYFVDPMSQKGQQAAQTKAQAQQEAQQLQLQVQTLDEQIAKYKVDQDNLTKLILELIQSDVEAAKLLGAQEIERLRAQGQGPADPGGSRGNGSNRGN